MKRLSLLFLCIFSFSITYLYAESTLYSNTEGKIQLYLVDNYRSSTTEGQELLYASRDEIVMTSGGSGVGGNPIAINKKDYTLNLIGIGVRSFLLNSMVFDVSFRASTSKAIIATWMIGGSQQEYSIRDFTSSIVSLKYHSAIRETLELNIGGGLARNVVHTDPNGNGGVFENIFFIPTLQGELNYYVNKKLSVGVGLNYDLRDKLEDVNFEYDFNPLSIDLLLSFNF